MAQNYIILTLDTTAPDVEVLTPSYTTADTKTSIVVKANEVLSEWQEIYIIDSNGERHDVTFRYENDTFIGEIIFGDNYPLGIATIYARVMDEAGNLSSIISKSINVFETQYVSVNVGDSVISDISIKSENYRDVVVDDELIYEIIVDEENKYLTFVKDNVAYKLVTDVKTRNIVAIKSEEVE